MADNWDSEPTIRTVLQRVLDNADSRTPRRPRSSGAGAQRTLLTTSSSRRLSSRTKTSAKQRSHGVRSIGRLAHIQVIGNLKEQTPRTLVENILITAPKSSILTPEAMVKPVPALQVVQPSRRESSQGSLELQLPELEPRTTLAAGLPASDRKKQRLRLSVFQQEVDQGLPHLQEHPENADAPSLTSSFNLTFATPLKPQSVRRPGLARRPPRPRAIDVGALLQDLQDNSLALAPPGDSLKTPIANLPSDTVLEDTQPFSQPLVGCSPSVHRSLPNPFPTGTEDAERTTGDRTQSSGPGLQNHKVMEAEESQETMETEEPEGSSEDENTSDRPASPQLASSTPRFLQAKRLHSILEPAPPPDVAVLPSETREPVSARLTPRPRTAGSRPRQDSYKAGLNHYAKLFSFYAKMPMERKAFEMVEKCLDKYFQHLCNDLEVFAAHAGRKTVRPEDLELLMRRQGLITDQVSLYVLVERHLPLEYRQLLIPCAFSGNSVFPVQ
ncbi:centromere protein T, transcript variant X1 [Ictidomys tridecemlineatus]|uniref:centromere protein T isoform X2 n=1 Tax=Ictidomys tridecemlineatus TaxID=43179 RepID=UPI000B53DF61|nr:centromere protein T isoform X2 [Ictidomys tridecemlineatus]KAG3257012.1 centromere protein T, transcript variant X1 [Ictidomys tridecemlineatus]